MIDSKTFNRYAADPSAFRNDLLIDVSGNIKRFGDIIEKWQVDDFAAIDPAMKRAASRSNEPARMSAWIERPRGHDKTSGIATVCTWALAFANRPLKGYAYAADRDQSGLLKAAMHTIIRLNPWLAQILNVQKSSVVNIAAGHPGNGGTLTIEASDVASSWGVLPDLLVADEIGHWPDAGEQLWHSIISSAAKRRNCALIAILNAGFADDWQWNVREAIRTDPSWYFSRLDGPVASWMTPDRLESQRRQLPPIAFARLWLNQWSSGGGDAIRADDVHSAFIDDLEPMTGREPGFQYVGGLDLSVNRDHSAFVVLAVPVEGHSKKIRLAHLKRWIPNPKIDFQEVENHIRAVDKAFDLVNLVADPYQAEHVLQRLEDYSLRYRPLKRIGRNKRKLKYGTWAIPLPQVGNNLRAIAAIMIECFSDRRMQLFDDARLRQDLLRLRVEETSYGFRLRSPRSSEGGHGDAASALSYALLIAHELAGIKTRIAGAYNGDSLKSVSQRQADFNAEMATLSRDDPQEGLRDIIGRRTNF